jgi:hypothetical protein
MVTRQARALFAVLLAFALLPIVSTTATGSALARTHVAPAWMQSSAKAQSTVQPARDAGGPTKHHPDATPFAAAETFQFGLRASIGATTPTTPRAIPAGASLALYPARAPPALL